MGSILTDFNQVGLFNVKGEEKTTIPDPLFRTLDLGGAPGERPSPRSSTLTTAPKENSLNAKRARSLTLLVGEKLRPIAPTSAGFLLSKAKVMAFFSATFKSCPLILCA